jgi:hypothetical protein
MRVNWFVSNPYISISDIHAACFNFFEKYHRAPDTVKMTYTDMSSFITSIPNQVQTLERGKDYGLFLPVPGGMVELLVLEHEDESVVNATGMKFIVVESTVVDREFEKHVLKG